MKIYAKSSNYAPRFASKRELDKYIGTDVWVKILYNESDIVENGNYAWINILSKAPDGYVVNFFYDFQINHPSGVSLEERHLDNANTIYSRNFSVCNPIETMTTDEIYDKYL